MVQLLLVEVESDGVRETPISQEVANFVVPVAMTAMETVETPIPSEDDNTLKTIDQELHSLEELIGLQNRKVVALGELRRQYLSGRR